MSASEPLIIRHLREEVPSAPQMAFFRSTARYTAYGGARGGGKSWALRRKLIMLAMRYDGLRVLLCRRTLQELRENHTLPMQAELAGYATYRADERAFAFPNGSRIKLGYCDADTDLSQYQGQEYDVIAIDEATEFAEDWVRTICATLRSTRDDGFRLRVYFTCNPGGIGHAWVKRLFIDRDFREGEDPSDYAFIPAKVTDNAVLMRTSPDYMKMLDALPPHLRAAHRDGNWDIYTGKVFSEFRKSPDVSLCKAAGITVEEAIRQRRYTHRIKPFDPPQSWRRYMSFDYGYTRPFSCGFWAADEDGRLYRILELYGCQRDANGVSIANTGLQWTPEQIFTTIAQTIRKHPYLKGCEVVGVADPAIWDRSTGVSVYDRAEAAGVYFERGDHKRIAGLQECHQRLQFDENGYPMLYVFENCRDFLRTVPALIYDRTRVEDVDSSQEDHIYDETRYMAMYCPLPERKNGTKDIQVYDPLSEDGMEPYRYVSSIYV